MKKMKTWAINFPGYVTNEVTLYERDGVSYAKVSQRTYGSIEIERSKLFSICIAFLSGMPLPASVPAYFNIERAPCKTEGHFEASIEIIPINSLLFVAEVRQRAAYEVPCEYAKLIVEILEEYNAIHGQ